MNRKSIIMLLAGISIGVLLGSGLFNEAQEAQLSKSAWIASTVR